MIQTPRRLSVSSWALHPLIGTVAPGRPGDPSATLMTPHTGSLDLLHVPRALAARGYKTMELCHFHLPDHTACYLEEWASAREEAGVELWSLLIDDADLTHPTDSDLHREWVLEWVRRASLLGARCVRVIAGKQPTTTEQLAKSIAQLKIITMEAYMHGVRVLTENWFPLLATPEAVEAVLDVLGGSVGLTLDFGNWSGPDKYERLEQIAHYAEGCHAKCEFQQGQPVTEDFLACLEITQRAGFSGPYTLVHGEPSDVWESLDKQRTLVEPYL